MVTEVRRVRSEMHWPEGRVDPSGIDVELLSRHAVGLDDLCNVTKIEQGEKDGPSVTIVVQGRDFYTIGRVIDLMRKRSIGQGTSIE